MGKIKVKDFEIISYFTGCRIAGYENQVAYYIVYKPTGKRVDAPIFYRKSTAIEWLRKTVKVANAMASERSGKSPQKGD